jgi:hypothetical protein
MKYQLEKFDKGPVYYLKSTDESTDKSTIEAIINIQEIKDQAEYYINIVTCKQYDVHNISLHGSFLNLQTVLQIAANVLSNNPNIYDNIIKTSDLTQ